MEMIILNNIKNQVIAGIYKFDFPNGKSYIGQSRNIYKRISEHNQRAKKGKHGQKDIQLCEKAIAKYGLITDFILLEKVQDVSVLDEREFYWINYYHTNQKEYGYNLTEGGDVSNKVGCSHPNALLNQEQLNEVIDLLLNHTEFSYIDIAQKYNVNKEVIEKIAAGKTYVNPNLTYPLRKNNHDSVCKNEISDYFNSEQEILNLKEELKYNWTMTIEQLAQKYYIPMQVIREINLGRKFQSIGDYIYPIREKNLRNNFNFTQEGILQILDLLHNTSMTMEQIGKQFNISRSSIRKINIGQTYIIKDYNYPARITK